MPLLGESLRYFEPEHSNSEAVGQHILIDSVMRVLYRQMNALAPLSRHRNLPFRTPRQSNKAFYKPYGPDHEAEMSTWLEVSRDKERGHEPIVRLYTQLYPGPNFLDYIGHGPVERASAFAGKLIVQDAGRQLDGWEFKQMRFESATNILTDIGETLDFIAQVK